MDEVKRKKILWILFLGVLMGALDIAIIAPALPVIRNVFGIDDRIGAWTFTIYVLFNLIGTPLMAKLSDIYGRRGIYILDISLFALGSLIVALTPTGYFAILLVGRALQGFGAGGIFPVASAVIGDTFPVEKRGRALGLIGAVFGIAFLIGPILGGLILSFLSWHWLFVINLPIALILILMSLKTLPGGKQSSHKPFDWAGMATLSLALASIAYALNAIDTSRLFPSLLSITIWPLFLFGFGAFLVFISIERRALDPILHLQLFASRQVWIASLLSAGAGLGEVGLVFIPSLAIAALGVDQTVASYFLMPVVLALAVGSPLAGRMLDKFGSKVVTLSGSILLGIGMVMLSMPTLTTQFWSFILAGGIVGLGLSALLGAPVRYIMLNEAPPAERTAAQGALAIFTSVGQLTSSAAVGAIAASRGGGMAGYGSAYLVTGFVAMLLVLLTLGLKNQAQELAHARLANSKLDQRSA